MKSASERWLRACAWAIGLCVCAAVWADAPGTAGDAVAVFPGQTVSDTLGGPGPYQQDTDVVRIGSLPGRVLSVRVDVPSLQPNEGVSRLMAGGAVSAAWPLDTAPVWWPTFYRAQEYRWLGDGQDLLIAMRGTSTHLAVGRAWTISVMDRGPAPVLLHATAQDALALQEGQTASMVLQPDYALVAEASTRVSVAHQLAFVRVPVVQGRRYRMLTKVPGSTLRVSAHPVMFIDAQGGTIEYEQWYSWMHAPGAGWLVYRLVPESVSLSNHDWQGRALQVWCESAISEPDDWPEEWGMLPVLPTGASASMRLERAFVKNASDGALDTDGAQWTLTPGQHHRLVVTPAQGALPAGVQISIEVREMVGNELLWSWNTGQIASVQAHLRPQATTARVRVRAHADRPIPALHVVASVVADASASNGLGETPEAAIARDFSEELAGALHGLYDEDWYRVSLPQGAWAQLEVLEPTGPVEVRLMRSPSDPEARRAPARVEQRFDRGVAWVQVRQPTFPSGVTPVAYRLRVKRTANPMSDDDWPDTPARVTRAQTPGSEPIAFRRNKEQDEDWCAFDLSLGHGLNLTGATCEVRDPLGRPVALGLDGTEIYPSTFVATQEGRYFVRPIYPDNADVLRVVAQISNLRQVAAFPHDQPGGRPQVLVPGVAQEVRIDHAYDFDLLDVLLGGRRIMELELRGDNVWRRVHFPERLWQSTMSLRDGAWPMFVSAHNVPRATDWWMEGDNFDDLHQQCARFTINTTGGPFNATRLTLGALTQYSFVTARLPETFTVLLRDFGEVTGDAHGNTMSTSTLIRLNEPVAIASNSTWPTSEQDWVHFEARAGHVYDITPRDSGAFRVVGPDGRVLWPAALPRKDIPTAVCVQADADGPMYITRSLAASGAGHIIVRVRDRGWFPPDVNGPNEPMPMPTQITGSMFGQSDVDVYQLGFHPIYPTRVVLATEVTYPYALAGDLLNVQGVSVSSSDSSREWLVRPRAVGGAPGAAQLRVHCASSDGRPFVYNVRTLRAGAMADVAGVGGAPGPDGAFTADDAVAFVNAFVGGDLIVADVWGGPRNIESQTGPNPDGVLDRYDVEAFAFALINRR